MTLVIALLVSLAAPALAVTHGLAHAHLAHEHGEPAAHESHGEHADHDEAPAPTHVDDVEPAAAFEPAEHGHHHDHATLAVAPAGRDLLRLTAAVGPAVVPTSARTLQTNVVVRSPALTDRALLARPGPPHGPPPTLRAPPAR